MSETITVEPHWPGMRRFVLNLYRTDPAQARRIAAAMGREAPTLPDDERPDMSTRSKLRQEFLDDIISTAVEGGTNEWAQVSQYQYEHGGELKACIGPIVGDCPRAVLHELLDDESGYAEEGHVVTADTIAAGIERILRGEVLVNMQIRDAIVVASRHNDAGMIDAGSADAIVQAALFGEVRY